MQMINYKKLGGICFAIIMVLLVGIVLLNIVRQQPSVAVAVRSWSMEPGMTRGDLVFISPVSENTNLEKGDVIVFRSEDDGIRDWTLHKIVGGDKESGFITQGDNNDYIDQDRSNYPPVKQEWIAGVVPTIGSTPIKIPRIGHLPLWLGDNLNSTNLIPISLVILVAVLIVDELFLSKKKKRKKKDKDKELMEKGQLYFLGGTAFAFIMGVIMIMSSLFTSVPYAVDGAAGVLMGSDVGVLEQGTEKELDIANLSNEGFFSSLYYAESNDPNIVLKENNIHLKAGESKELTATIYAEEPGTHKANIKVGMFLPFLPSSVISFFSINQLLVSTSNSSISTSNTCIHPAIF